MLFLVLSIDGEQICKKFIQSLKEQYNWGVKVSMLYSTIRLLYMYNDEV